MVPSSVGGGNAQPLGAFTWSRMEPGVSDLVRESGVGPLRSALGPTSPYTAPPGKEPPGQRFPNLSAPKVSRLPVCDFGELCGARGACSLEEQAWGVSLSGVPGGDGVNCHEQRDPAHEATKPAHKATAHEATKPVYRTKATWGGPLSISGRIRSPLRARPLQEVPLRASRRPRRGMRQRVESTR